MMGIPSPTEGSDRSMQIREAAQNHDYLDHHKRAKNKRKFMNKQGYRQRQ